jgi:hypothetical protein
VLRFSLPPQNSAGKAHGWIKILKISIDLASWHPVSKENSKGELNCHCSDREPKRIRETLEKELEKLTDILVNRYG